jgi:hypothetical protein
MASWTDLELASAVEAYRRMQWLDQAGIPFTKSALRAEYLAGPLAERSEGSFEYRMQNISWVLQRHRQPSLADSGYAPAANVGANLEATIWGLLQASDDNNKAYPVRQAGARLGLDPSTIDSYFSRGGTVKKSFLVEICRRLFLSSEGTKPELAERIARSESVSWDDDCDSRGTPSKGGSTVSAKGYRRVHSAIECSLSADRSMAWPRGPKGRRQPPPTVPERPGDDDRKSEYEYTSEEKRRRVVLVEDYLVKRYCAYLRDKGVEPVREKQVRKGRQDRCDVYVESRQHLIEAKGSNARSPIRMALGQLIDYGRFVGDPDGRAVLLPEKPDPDSIALTDEAGVSCVWATDEEFTAFGDNANGDFL